MFYQLKSNLKDRIVIFMFLFSFVVSLLNLFNLENSITSGNLELYYLYQNRFNSQELYTRELELYSNPHDEIQKNYINYNYWLADTYYNLSELYVDGYENNREEIQELKIKEFYYYQLIGDEQDIKDTSSLDMGDELSKYINLDDGFSLELLRDYKSTYNSPDFIRAQYYNSKLYVDRFLFLKENNLSEVDFNTLSPWTYLASNYGENNIRNSVLLPIFVIFSTYLILKSIKSRELNLINLVPMKKYYIPINFYISTFLLSLLILFLPDLIITIYLGIRYGFEGFSNPILIFKEGLTSFETYFNTGNYQFVGLSKIYPTKILSENNYFALPEFLENIEYFKFLFLSYIVEFLKLLFLTTLGVSIGLVIKNRFISVVLSGIFTLYSNPFNIGSGYDQALGWTNISYFGSVLLLLISVGILMALTSYLYSKLEIGE